MIYLNKHKCINILKTYFWKLSQNIPSEIVTPFIHDDVIKFSALLAINAENSPATGEFPAQRPVTGIFDVFFDLRLDKQLSKQS